MKNISSMKQIICNAKAKTVAIKSKAEEMKAQLLLLSLMLTGREKKELKFSLGLGAIADKIHSIFNLIGLRQRHDERRKISIDGEEEEKSRETTIRSVDLEEEEEKLVNEEDKYPDLRHSLFEEEGEDYDDDDDDDLYLGDPNGSVIDMVRNSKEEGGEKFILEDEIDHAADLFILKFHKNMRMQKLDSFKRYQQLLERSS